MRGRPKGSHNKTALERFNGYVIKPAKATDCWGWSGYIMWAGYATFTGGGKTHRAHRFSYEHFVGPIPPKFDIDHLCRNRSCTNPAHLEAVTHRTNVLRGIGLSGPTTLPWPGRPWFAWFRPEPIPPGGTIGP